MDGCLEGDRTTANTCASLSHMAIPAYFRDAFGNSCSEHFMGMAAAFEFHYSILSNFLNTRRDAFEKSIEHGILLEDPQRHYTESFL